LRFAHFPILLTVFSTAAFGDSSRTEHARQQLDRQLEQMVKPPPASLEIIFDGIDSTRYTLLESSFALDGPPLPVKVSGAEQRHTVLFSGEVTPGEHILMTRLVYEESARGGLFSYGSGIKFKVPGKFIITAQRGVALRVRARVEVDDGAEPSKRLELVGKVEADLRAKLEEGMPPPPERLAQAEERTEPAVQKQKPQPQTRPLRNVAVDHRKPKRKPGNGSVKLARGGEPPSDSLRSAVHKAEGTEPGSPTAQAGSEKSPSAATEPQEEPSTPAAVAVLTTKELPSESARPAETPPSGQEPSLPASDGSAARGRLGLGAGSLAVGGALLLALVALAIIRSRRRPTERDE
jgi:hypothetical protein